MDSAKIAVEKTTEQMPILKENNVVDSGAYGFLLFWEGALASLKGEVDMASLEEALNMVATENEASVDAVYHADLSGEIKFGFCTEGLASGVPITRDEVKARLETLGDSLIVTGDERLMKVHIHTNEPDMVLDYLGGLGKLVKTKVDNMREQHREKVIEIPRQAVRVLTDSTCDLDSKLRKEKGIEMVPLQVMFGEEAFRDRVDITTDEFYARLKIASEPPKTSLPSGSEYLKGLENLASHCDEILAIYLSSTLSGTWQVGRKWGSEFEGCNVTSYDSGNASLALGMMALEAARMAGKGEPVDAIVKRLDEIKAKVTTYFTVDNLDCLARSGRIGPAKKINWQYDEA